jgi:peptidyl-prolyl cis-trans isomerase D
LFILGSDFLSGNSSMFGSSANKLGEINGTAVDYQEFNKLVETQKLQFQQNSQRTPSEEDIKQIRDQIWEKLVFENAYLAEYEKLGITVSNDELAEMIQGTKNMHPYVKQQFTDQAGNFNQAQHAEFITAYTTNKMPQAQKDQWDVFKRELKTVRLREKYANLLNKASFITKAEAKAEYMANNEKANAKFLFVPFRSIVDSTIKVDDSQIKDYYNKHKDDFIPFDSRSISYVTYQIVPTKADSAALNLEIRNLAKGMAAAPNAQTFASANTDIKTPYVKSPNELSPDLKSTLATSIVGAMIGPFKEGNTYSIHKYEGTSTDSLYTARASQIFVRADSTFSDSLRAQAQIKALGILKQVMSGTDFATLAAQSGSDANAQNGGDMGVFQNNGNLIKPLEKAIFGYNGAGVIPSLVTTDFGYHIIKVTEAKSNIKYKLATINKELQVGESETNEIFQKAENLRATAGNLKGLEAAVKKDNSLTLQTADNIAPGAKNINALQNAAEIVQWAYKEDTKVGDVSDNVIIIGETYVVAVLKSASDKENPTALDFKDQISVKVRDEKKAEKILAKIGDGKGDLLAVSKKYGAGALVEEVKDINFFSGLLNSAGFDPIALGKIFGQKAGKRSAPFVGESGVFIVETSQKIAAAPIADYSLYKQQIAQRTGQGRSYVGDQIIRENAKIKDNRAKMF